VNELTSAYGSEELVAYMFTVDSVHTDVRNETFRTSKGFKYAEFIARIMQVNCVSKTTNCLNKGYREDWTKVHLADFSIAANIHTGSQERKPKFSTVFTTVCRCFHHQLGSITSKLPHFSSNVHFNIALPYLSTPSKSFSYLPVFRIKFIYKVK